jgi:uncharacterized membrane protein YkoI
MRIRIAVVTALLLVSATVVASAQDHEKKIRKSELPPAVLKTVDEQSKGATVRGFSQEREGGKTYYEAEMKVNGHTKDVLVDANGKVVEVEEDVNLAALPQPVRSALQEKAGTGTIRKVESITKENKLVAYEAQVVTAGKKSEIQVGPGGEQLEHAE